jgi:hypothetical protein
MFSLSRFLCACWLLTVERFLCTLIDMKMFHVSRKCSFPFHPLPSNSFTPKRVHSMGKRMFAENDWELKVHTLPKAPLAHFLYHRIGTYLHTLNLYSTYSMYVQFQHMLSHVCTCMHNTHHTWTLFVLIIIHKKQSHQKQSSVSLFCFQLILIDWFSLWNR